jgi:hypothetical protein
MSMWSIRIGAATRCSSCSGTATLAITKDIPTIIYWFLIHNSKKIAPLQLLAFFEFTWLSCQLCMRQVVNTLPHCLWRKCVPVPGPQKSSKQIFLPSKCCKLPAQFLTGRRGGRRSHKVWISLLALRICANPASLILHKIRSWCSCRGECGVGGGGSKGKVFLSCCCYLKSCA